MKPLKYIVLIGLSLVLYSNGYCLQKADSTKLVKINSIPKDSIEYELLVFDVGYDAYLATQPSMNFYSESYYKTWNALYVQEWNTRYRSHSFKELYENYIDYDLRTEYGLKVEYQLYYFFRYFEKTNNVTLIPRGR